MAININDSLLVVIDIQEKLMPVIFEREMVEANAIKLIKFAKFTGLPVLYTEQSKLGETISGVKAELGDIEPVSKCEFSCFLNDAFKEQVAKFNPKTLILTGVETHICVAQTALEALQIYKVHIVSDAVSSRTLENKIIGIERMRQAGAVITSVEMAMFELIKKAGTDEFKKTLSLVK